MFSQIPFENSVLRIDAEYFKKKYLVEDELLNKTKVTYLGNESFITDGQHGYHEVDENSSIRHLTAKNFKSWFANDVDADRLAKWVDDNNKRSSLEKNDIVLTTRGSVGYCAIVKEDVLPANIDQDVARIAIDTKSSISPQFLVTYLNSKFGQDWILRNQTGMVQQGLALWRVREIPIPILSPLFQNHIVHIVETSYNKITLSKECYKLAERNLLQELGMSNFEFRRDGVNIKDFQQSFRKTGRLDSEYYLKKYEDYSDIIFNYSGRSEKLKAICTLKDKNYSPIAARGYKYIELANIGKSGEINDYTFELGDNLPSRARRLVHTGDVIISSIEGSLQSCAIINSDHDNSICSTGFYVIRSKALNPETLLVLFKTELMQNILKQNCSGTILTAINKTEFLDLPLPLIPLDIQNTISNLITKSSKLRKESEQLLEIAKKSVEMAIEQTEKNAIDFIKSET